MLVPKACVIHVNSAQTQVHDVTAEMMVQLAICRAKGRALLTYYSLLLYLAILLVATVLMYYCARFRGSVLP